MGLKSDMKRLSYSEPVDDLGFNVIRAFRKFSTVSRRLICDLTSTL